MANGEYRYVWRIVWNNFVNSLKPKTIRGTTMGQDYMGNVYFEIPANSSTRRSKPSRWYDPPKGKDFQDPLPAEWESWLRYRRKLPPTEEEIQHNLAIINLKQINAKKLEEERLAAGGKLPTPQITGPDSYPKYSEYSHGDQREKEKNG